MENHIQFIEDLQEFKEKIKSIVIPENDCNLMVAGTFDNEVYKEVMERIISTENTKNARIIIPMVGKNGLVSRSYINKICGFGGQIRLNSKYKHNIIIVGEYAFIISFSSKYSAESGLKVIFECCVVTNEINTVEKICRKFNDIWRHSLPLVQN